MVIVTPGHQGFLVLISAKLRVILVYNASFTKHLNTGAPIIMWECVVCPDAILFKVEAFSN